MSDEMAQQPKDMTIKEFMEWYIEEYEDCFLLPSDFEKVLDRLEGYSLAKRNEPEAFILTSAVSRLRTAKNFFESVKRISGWEHKE